MNIRLLILLFLSVNIIFAQDENADPKSPEDYLGRAWRGDFRPYGEVIYGYVTPKHLNFSGNFGNLGSYDLHLGYGEVKTYRGVISSIDQRYLFGTIASEDYNIVSENATDDIKPEFTRFGIGNRLGFGYKLGVIELLPYNQMQYVWSKIETPRTDVITEEDNYILDRYEGTFRFGQSAEAGVSIVLSRKLAVSAGYEFAVVYPRHIFWPWLGSAIIQSTALGMVSVFSEDIVDTSPLFGPLMYFLLKNGVAYAFYQGQQEKMNWPFNSETPLTFETFRLGASILF